jgi:hypothetical protein
VVERAVGGFDAEVGWRVPVFGTSDTTQLRIYVGGYRFDDHVVDIVEGPRFRAELTLYDVSALWNGARVTVGGEVQHDDVRDTQTFGSLRIRIPLQDPSSDATPRTLTAMEQRMTDPVVRDIDIVSNKAQVGSLTTEVATQTDTNEAFTVINADTTTGADLASAVTAANDIVILVGDFNTTAPVTLNTGQRMYGFAHLDVKGASNTVATAHLPGASILATGAPSALTLTPSSELHGMDIAAVNGTGGTTYAINMMTAHNVSIYDSTIIASDDTGQNAVALNVFLSTDMLIDNSLIAASTLTANAIGINAIFANNLILTESAVAGIGQGIGSTSSGMVVFSVNQISIIDSDIAATADSTATAFSGNAIDNFVFTGNTVLATAETTANSVDLANLNIATIDNNAIGGFADFFGSAFAIETSTGVTVSNNLFEASGATTDTAFFASGVDFTVGSTGNEIDNGNGACVDGSGNTGNIVFIDSSTCP